MERYFGTYQTFQTASRKEAGALMGSDNLVGDTFSVDCTIDKEGQKAWIVNRFGKRIGYFDADFSRELSLKKAQGMEIVAILSFVAFSEQPEPGHYWGNVAVIAYDPREKAFPVFVDKIAQLIAKGIRPKIDFDSSAVDEIISSEGTWTPTEREPMPQKQKGMAILKQRRSLTDTLVEQGRKGNKGCYLLSWAFLLGIVAAIIFGLKSCGLF